MHMVDVPTPQRPDLLLSTGAPQLEERQLLLPVTHARQERGGGDRCGFQFVLVGSD